MSTTIRFDTTPIISVNGIGITYGTFDAATYSITIKDKGKNGPKAKAGVRVIQKKLFAALEKLKLSGVTFVPGKTRSTLSVGKDFRTSIFSGYTATFNLIFRSRNLDRMSEIHDVLTSIEGTEVASPYFLLDPESKEDLRREAFKKAVAQAKQRFAEQCEIFDINPDNYEIISWSSRGGRDINNNLIALSNFSPLENDTDFCLPVRANNSVESGESRIEVSLDVNFNKIKHAMKA